MDYGFTQEEIMIIYSDYAKKIAEYEVISKSGTVKIISSEDKAHRSIIKKLLAKHPNLNRLDQFPL